MSTHLHRILFLPSFTFYSNRKRPHLLCILRMLGTCGACAPPTYQIRWEVSAGVNSAVTLLTHCWVYFTRKFLLAILVFKRRRGKENWAIIFNPHKRIENKIMRNRDKIKFLLKGNQVPKRIKKYTNVQWIPIFPSACPTPDIISFSGNCF